MRSIYYMHFIGLAEAISVQQADTLCWLAGCPVVTADFNPSNLMPQSSNRPAPDQSQPLGTERVLSTIPTSKLGPYAFDCHVRLTSIPDTVLLQVTMGGLLIRNPKALFGCIQASRCFIMP